MIAYYYSIIELKTKQIVDEGIIRTHQCLIYPGLDSEYELPIECHADKFKAEGFKLIGWYIQLGRGDVKFHCIDDDCNDELFKYLF